MKEFLLKTIRNVLSEAGILVTAVEGRVKTEESLVGKLELKGSKYSCLEDITDILGLRVITFYTDDVDKVASVMERLFEIDWENSIDQRKLHKLNSFGYNSLHYICRLPKETYTEADCPAVNRVRFEIQMRTTLQHAWANMYHDTGYKSGVEIPDNYLRNLPEGSDEIAEYYFIAPQIVSAIKQRADAMLVFNSIYEKLVTPCVNMIECGENEQAHILYKETV